MTIDDRRIVDLAERFFAKYTSINSFTEAVITQPVLRIDAEVGSGALTLVTKPGIVVDMDEVTVRSGALEVKAPWGQDASVLRIEMSGKVG